MRLPIAWFYSCALMLALILSPGLTSAAVPDLTVGNYTLVSKTRVGRLDYELAYKATLTNRGQASVAGATAHLTNVPGIFVADGQLSFGLVDPGQTVWSTDTFTLRWPINQAISPKILQLLLRWQITSTVDAAPIANAGPDQTVALGATVTLDGSASSDPDGGPKPLAYQWALVTKPAGSTAVLSSTSASTPGFVADKPGSYTVQLIVNDGALNSTPDTVDISTLNSPPVAHAGADQTVFVGTTVRLDGSASTDVDGNPLGYLWNFTQIPAGSAAALSSTTVPTPTFLADKSGSYFVQLIVNDGKADSPPDSVTISTQNSPPVAHAGNDQTVFVGTTVNLDGSGSTDVDGDHLTHRWALLGAPTGSTSTLANATAFNPTIKIDKPGSYTIQLIVNDGTVDSPADTVVISTKNSPPVADAGPAQTVFVNTTVSLDGSGSSDADGDPLTYQWALLSKPVGSASVLADATHVNPTLHIDKPGNYTLQLIVNDSTVDSGPATVIISTQNSRPVADAGPRQAGFVNTLVTFDGSASSDADGDSLAYDWSITSFPGTTAPNLSASTAVKPTFTPGLVGDYIAQLIVNDGHINSDPATSRVTVTVGTPVNNPPHITTSPVLTAIVGSLYSYDMDATDADNDTLTYSLTTKPTGMTINAQTGLINWTPGAGQTGSQSVTVNVIDGKGGSDSQSFTVTVIDASQVTVPDLLNKSRAAAETAIQQAKLTLGTLSFEHNAIADGSVINQSPAANSSVAEGATVNLTISLGPDQGLPPNPETVAPVIDTTVATTTYASTQFLYSGSNPIQTGVAPGTIDAKRAAVIRGKVLDKSNAPQPGATIRVLNHPEFGQTLSRADGWFDLAVNGGGLLTINYTLTGYLPVQRQVNVPWRDFVTASDIVLIPRDGKVTTVAANAAVMQVARQNVVSDSAGTRQATVLFPAGTGASIVLPDGTLQPVATLNIRATEYTVGPDGPNAMPAELPPTSGYTYAVELSADEAVANVAGREVVFTQPVPIYLENFLGFPIGENVPVGYYDRDAAAWVPSTNGRVIKITAVNGGIATVDTVGTGGLPPVVLTATELQNLASLYSVGQELWRTPVTHFSAYDFNWGIFLPQAAGMPTGEAPEKNEPLLDNSCKVSGNSSIECQNQILGETIGVVGTPFALQYQSERVPGGKSGYQVDIPLSGAQLPGPVTQIEMVIQIAGRFIRQSFPPSTNQRTTFIWDGKDVYGRRVQGGQPFSVRTGNTYDGVYLRTPRFGDNGTTLITGSNSRQQLTLWSNWTTGIIGTWDARDNGLGGWLLSAHHAYDPVDRVLYRGDGGRQTGLGFGATISTFAGPGNEGSNIAQCYSGEGVPALGTRVCPSALATGPDGSLYIAESAGQRVRKVAPDGLITTVAGTGVLCSSSSASCGDGGPATQAQLNIPQWIAVGPDGSLYISNNLARVRKVAPNGIITTIAGTGIGGFSGDDGPAELAQFNNPQGVAVGPDSSVYIADGNNHRIRRVGPDGIVTTVVGTGGSCLPTAGCGDGDAATLAQLISPRGLAIGRDGSLYISDNNRIRQVAPNGNIRTLAGTGEADFSGDAGPANLAQLNQPMNIALGPDDSIYIADSGNSRVRWMRPDGMINTLAGTGIAGRTGDGGLALQAEIQQVRGGIAVGPDGSVYVGQVAFNETDTRVRRIAPLLSQVGAAGAVIPSQDGSEVYILTLDGRHLQTKDAITGALRYQFAYDSAGRLSSVTDVDGNVTTIQHDGSGNPTAIVGPFGQSTALAVNPNGFLSQITSPAGENVQITYTTDGLLTRLTNPRGHSSSYAFDSKGRLISATDPTGAIKTLVRSGTNKDYTVTMTTALGRATTYRVEQLSNGDERRTTTDPAGKQTQTVRGQNGSQTATYPDGTTVNAVLGPDPRWGMRAPLSTSVVVTTPGGKINTITTQRTATLTNPSDVLSLATINETVTINGRGFTSAFNAANRTFTHASPTGRQTITVVDLLGKPVQAQFGGLAPNSFTYDLKGRLDSATQGSGAGSRTTTLAYGVDGFLQSVTDAASRTSSLTRDANGRIIDLTFPDGGQSHFIYDANGNVTTITPPDHPDHTFTYNQRNQVSTYTAPVVSTQNSQTLTTYDADRQPLQVDRPDGESVAVQYDSAGRPSLVDIALGDSLFSYDAAGRLASLNRDQGVNLTYVYDGGLPTGTSWSGDVAGSVTRLFDNNFRVISLSVNGNDPIALDYDLDGLPVKVGDLTLTRNVQNGLVTGTALGTVTDAMTYDVFGAPATYTTSQSGSAVYSTTYTRDALGRIASKSETIGGITHAFAYTYDLAGRLTEVRHDNVLTASYAYDTNGNRLSRTNGGGTTTATYDAQDRLDQFGSTTYVHNANGERQSKTAASQTTTYQYDTLGNLTGVTLPGATQIDYLLDGQERRVGKKINGTLVQGFLYQDGLKPIAELDASNNVVSRFVYSISMNVPAYMIKAGVTYKIVTDHVGSPRLVFDSANGSIVQRLDYDEFGKVTVDTNPGFQPFGFAGGLYDRDTQLVHFGAREYDSDTARWTTKDPIGFGGEDSNLYAYVGGDPVNKVDPVGLITTLEGCFSSAEATAVCVETGIIAGKGGEEAAPVVAEALSAAGPAATNAAQNILSCPSITLPGMGPDTVNVLTSIAPRVQAMLPSASEVDNRVLEYEAYFEQLSTIPGAQWFWDTGRLMKMYMWTLTPEESDKFLHELAIFADFLTKGRGG